jgi:hypothetical protein
LKLLAIRADSARVRRTRSFPAAVAAALALVALAVALFAASASATFEATLAARQSSVRADGPTFVVEAGGGRRTRIIDLEVDAGKCGSIYAPLIDASKAAPGFAAGRGAATFALQAQHLSLRIELRLHPRGEGLVGEGVLQAAVGDCHERLPLDLVSTAIRGGGRHAQG